MNRRKLLSLAASLPIIGAFVKDSDGVALRSASHPIGPTAQERELDGIVTREISLTRYAAAGEQVTCENGHPICKFVCDVGVGQPQDLPRQLSNWTQEAPELGEIKSTCAVCGGEFYRGGVFHFRDGWRRTEGLRVARR